MSDTSTAQTITTGAGPSGAGFNLRPLYVVAAIGAIAAFAFAGGIENLFKRWGEQQELSHGYFLPLIAAWMIWSRRDALRGRK